MTRSVVATAHGDVRGAIRFHAFGPLVVIALIATAGGLVPAARRFPRRAGRVLAGVGIVVWTVYVVDRARRRTGVSGWSGASA